MKIMQIFVQYTSRRVKCTALNREYNIFGIVNLPMANMNEIMICIDNINKIPVENRHLVAYATHEKHVRSIYTSNTNNNNKTDNFD